MVRNPGVKNPRLALHAANGNGPKAKPQREAWAQREAQPLTLILLPSLWPGGSRVLYKQTKQMTAENRSVGPRPSIEESIRNRVETRVRREACRAPHVHTTHTPSIHQARASARHRAGDKSRRRAPAACPDATDVQPDQRPGYNWVRSDRCAAGSATRVQPGLYPGSWEGDRPLPLAWRP